MNFTTRLAGTVGDVSVEFDSPRTMAKSAVVGHRMHRYLGNGSPAAASGAGEGACAGSPNKQLSPGENHSQLQAALHSRSPSRLSPTKQRLSCTTQHSSILAAQEAEGIQAEAQAVITGDGRAPLLPSPRGRAGGVHKDPSRCCAFLAVE